MSQPVLSPPRSPPCPNRLSLLWAFLAEKGNRERFAWRVAQQYGDIVWLNLPKESLYLVSNPAYIKHFLVAQGEDNYHKQGFRPGIVAGEALSSTSNGAFWKRHRRMVQPAFQRARLLSSVPLIADAVRRVLDRHWEPLLRSGEPILMLREMSRLVLSVMSQLICSEDPSDEVSELVWRYLVPAIYPRPPHRLLMKRKYPDLLATAHKLDAFAWKTVRERMAQPEQPDDMLGLLINARDEKDERMTEREVRDEFMDLFYGGHVSTGLALCWMWYRLDAHPEVFTRMAESVEQALGGRAPTAADVPSLEYVNQVFNETLRHHPPAPGVSRLAVKADTIGDFAVPEGTLVCMSNYVMHHKPEFWRNPEAFDPEHFSAEQVQARPRFVFMPFGGGQRVCIGAMLASLIAQVSTALMLQRYRLELVPGTKVVPKTGGAHFPHNLWMKVLPAKQPALPEARVA
ncbi:cytochrome P450 [Pyxidicoccus trucidator]|uniref:cytochrome P450 n=1 Tax=Pyxidicoccus trucidator TaxID=2709662 RepID=UPI0023DDFB4B|nr:cytochrome P450 [Pyxidicoccus trucidator]